MNTNEIPCSPEDSDDPRHCPLTGAAMRAAVFLPALYVTVAILSNISSLRIITVLGLTMDAGTLLYPFSFTIRDLIHKALGVGAARATIMMATVLNALTFVVFWIAAKLPADADTGPQTEFGEVLLPGARIVLGSTIAMCAAELIDTEIYAMVHRRFGERHKWARVALSNLISIPVDTVLMTLVAFAGRYPTKVLVEITLVNIALKYAVTAFSINWIYFVKSDRK